MMRTPPPAAGGLSAQRDEEVSNGRTGRGGHHPNGLQVSRAGSLARLIKQTLGREQGLSAQECLIEAPLAGRLHAHDSNLKITPRLIQPSARKHFDHLALRGLAAKAGRIPTKQHGPKAGLGVSQGQVAVATGRHGELGHLAHNPHAGELPGQGLGHQPIEGPNGEDFLQISPSWPATSPQAAWARAARRSNRHISRASR